MYYYRFELTNEETGQTKVYMVRRDSVPYFWEMFVNQLNHNCTLTTKGRLDVSNEYRKMFEL